MQTLLGLFVIVALCAIIWVIAMFLFWVLLLGGLILALGGAFYAMGS